MPCRRALPCPEHPPQTWGQMLVQRPTIAFRVDGHSPQEVAYALAARQIAIWSGHSYALELMKAYGFWETGGVARAGVVRYTTEDDVARLLDAVQALKP